ncbi:HAMP domain-containing histidine kinase [Irregularibacter muris]|uniref:histidine kinase n=1 Tax=Irregularibacter muris TaxID=1796619 RepID=A0AAE3HED7_9FIRM|nr:HAMP domain-containing sensor histidine kinase [Irregularibacter muris]MCR1898917.1 HAMP domain-containing histidine kinase [Irregularibacter muris]
MGSRTLKGLLTRFVITELFYSIIVVFLILFGIAYSIGTGFTYPADYPEKQFPLMEERVRQGEVTLDDFPSFYGVQIEDKNGEILSSTMETKDREYVKNAKEEGSAQSAHLFASKQFMYLQNEGQNIILSYRIGSDFMSPVLRKYLPNAEVLLLIVSFALWVLGFLLILGYFTRGIYKELIKISETNDEIRQMNLDFPVPKSKVKEINQVLTSLDMMRQELASSLKKQWQVQKSQRDTLQALTHDIRTPITLINGNLELIQETQPSPEQSELLMNLEKGVTRLNQYIQELKELSGISSHKEEKSPITKQLISDWCSFAKSMAMKNKINIKIIHKQSSKLLIQSEELSKAFQNVLQNAVDYSPEGSDITLSFEDHPEEYRITVMDSGQGFSEEALKQGTRRFYTSSAERSGHIGLGLTIVHEIMMKNRGRVTLSNEKVKDEIIGGKVILTLKK